MPGNDDDVALQDRVHRGLRGRGRAHHDLAVRRVPPHAGRDGLAVGLHGYGRGCVRRDLHGVHHVRDGLRRRLFDYFGGLTDTRQRNAGAWKVGNVVFHDDIVIYRVLAVKQHPARRFLMDLKEELERELRQQEILIVEREVEVL